MTLPPPPPPKTPPASPPKQTGLTFRRAADVTPRYRVVLNARPGWGKTTVMAYAPNPVILTAPMEHGIDILRANGRVPDVPSLPFNSTAELIGYIKHPAVRDFDTLCIDALSGIETMLKAEVLTQQFSGDEKKYASWGHGDAAVGAKFRTIISALDTYPGNIIIGSHSAVARFNDPYTDGYSRYESNCTKHVWNALVAWANTVLFGTYFTVVKDGKAVGGKDRIVYTEEDAAHDAKNQYGLPNMIQVPNDPAKAYESIFGLITGAAK